MDKHSFQDLIAPMDDAALAQLLERARATTLQRFGRVIQLYAPLYLSNECVDSCTYCGFSLANKIERRTLTVDETVEETSYLIAQGFRHILYDQIGGRSDKMSISLHLLQDILEKKKKSEEMK